MYPKEFIADPCQQSYLAKSIRVKLFVIKFLLEFIIEIVNASLKGIDSNIFDKAIDTNEY